MRICLMLEGQEGIEWEQWRALAAAAEEAGLDGFFRSDHYRSILRGEPAGSLDAWATLAALGASTTRIRLGTLVSPVTFRPPSVLAKNAVTVDHISGGRVELGVGAGWYEAEHETYGFPFPSTRERFDELERQLAEIHRQWAEGSDAWPKPLQQPRPPIILGGSAKPRGVSLAIRFADEYNTTFATVDQARERRRALDSAAQDARREPLTFSIMTGCVVGRDAAEAGERLARWRQITHQEGKPTFSGTVDEVVEDLRAYERVGVERAMLQHLDHDDVEMVVLLGELAAALAA
jgi:alkanesulfonate monooxygenase SsuD/methylene tetrahydromethanopterin reductase-like flavin-dependent oxidoreductase (luciferase family)